MTGSDWKKALKNLKAEMEKENDQMLEDEFLTIEELVPIRKDALRRALRRILSEVDEFFREKRWEEILALIYPVEEKAPELVEASLELELRAKAAFALGHLMRFEEAIKELLICVKREPNTFRFHSSLAYTAYNSLYAGLNKEIFLRGKIKAERIKLAHHHFQRAQELRPDGITNFYRQGMLFKQIERKVDKSIPLFEKAIQNWERLDKEAKEKRVQERKNYVKSLYQISSALLESNRPGDALDYLNRCLSEDEESEYITLLHKYFALGKIYFSLNRFEETRKALEFALTGETNKPPDFVFELLARTHLALGNALEARKAIEQIPEKYRRPYFRWTEADVLCALKDYREARKVLLRCAERDKRSAHKAYIRLAKINYLLGNFTQSRDFAKAAGKFFNQTWGGHLDDALFWEALSCYRLGECGRAAELAELLKQENPRYPKLSLLLSKLNKPLLST